MRKSKADTRSFPPVQHALKAFSSFREESGLNEVMALLGIPVSQRTDAVKLAVSALLERLGDMTQEAGRAQERFAELERLVDVDCIAPVPNRRAFMRRLSWAISMFERYHHPCSIIYFDINGFKNVNDVYGHAAGDMAIRHISEILMKSLRASDFMARLSGDEFAILMYYAYGHAAHERGKSIAAQIGSAPMIWQKNHIALTSAFGAYEIRKGDDAEIALSRADAAMYAHKRSLKEQVGDVTA